jgi:alpha-L-fucosidase 2
MTDDEGWVLLQLGTKKDWWNPSLMEDNSGEGPRPLKVTFSGPAKHWTDAIPIANGRLGAMIWGGVASETLQLNGNLMNMTLRLELLYIKDVAFVSRYGNST